MPQPNIKWRDKDISKLKRVVKNFNAKRVRIIKKNPTASAYLPTKVSYKELKNQIETREDFNREIKSLLRFSKKGAESIVSNDNGLLITKWERREIGLKVRRINNSRKKIRDRLNPSVKTGTMGLVQEVGLRPKKDVFKDANRKKWEAFKETVHFQARSNYWADRYEQYLKNYIKSAENHLGVYADLIATLAKMAGGQFLFDIYPNEPSLQIDYTYNLEQADFLAYNIVDTFARYGYKLPENELWQLLMNDYEPDYSSELDDFMDLDDY